MDDEFLRSKILNYDELKECYLEDVKRGLSEEEFRTNYEDILKHFRKVVTNVLARALVVHLDEIENGQKLQLTIKKQFNPNNETIH